MKNKSVPLAAYFATEMMGVVASSASAAAIRLSSLSHSSCSLLPLPSRQGPAACIFAAYSKTLTANGDVLLDGGFSPKKIMGADDDELIHCGEDFGKEGEHGTSSSWKWRLVIAYDGTQYLGWQWQPKGGSVQYMIEDALMKVTRCTRKDLLVVAASRTDAGVHAWGQVAHFVTPFCFERLDRLHLSLNGILPQDIRIREIAAAQPNFHARYYAHKKMYHYTVYVAAVMDPCQRFYAWHVRESLNIGAMTEAAQFFVGVHDFTTFANSSKDSVQRDLAREILSFNIVDEAPILRFEVEGTGFFYKQVRNMVSLLLEVGKGILPPRSVCDLLASHDRTKLARVCVTAPPQGLCLISVSYDEIFLAAPRKFHLESTHHLHHV